MHGNILLLADMHWLLPHDLQELHSASSFKPPPTAPEASLARASHLAKQSLIRRSQLGKVSQGLNRASRQLQQGAQAVAGHLGRTSAGLARMSRDPAAAMQVSAGTSSSCSLEQAQHNAHVRACKPPEL